MQVKNLQEPFAHSIIDNFFDDAELPSVFSEINLTFPILILRNSVFIIDKKIKIHH